MWQNRPDVAVVQLAWVEMAVVVAESFAKRPCWPACCDENRYGQQYPALVCDVHVLHVLRPGRANVHPLLLYAAQRRALGHELCWIAIDELGLCSRGWDSNRKMKSRMIVRSMSADIVAARLDPVFAIPRANPVVEKIATMRWDRFELNPTASSNVQLLLPHLGFVEFADVWQLAPSKGPLELVEGRADKYACGVPAMVTAMDFSSQHPKAHPMILKMADVPEIRWNCERFSKDEWLLHPWPIHLDVKEVVEALVCELVKTIA